MYHGIVTWAHDQDYLPTLRRHPKPFVYYRDMGRVSRAREFLAKVYPEQDMAMVPNDVIYATAHALPRSLPVSSRRNVNEATKRHCRELSAWINHEGVSLQDWATANDTTPMRMLKQRYCLVDKLRGVVPFERLAMTASADVPAMQRLVA